MDIEILYVDGCPNLVEARAAVEAALSAEGVAAAVRETEVRDAATAERVGMRGSPTVLVDGCDAVGTDEPTGSVSCRLYLVEGHLRGAPTVDQVVEALRG